MMLQQPNCHHGLQETEAQGMSVFSFEAFSQLGSERPSPANPPQPEDLCTIMYTSGTTDKPKVTSHTFNSLLRLQIQHSRHHTLNSPTPHSHTMRRQPVLLGNLLPMPGLASSTTYLVGKVPFAWGGGGGGAMERGTKMGWYRGRP